jgi:hypothetical protein
MSLFIARGNVLSCSFTGKKFFAISATSMKGKLPEEAMDVLLQTNYTQFW